MRATGHIDFTRPEGTTVLMCGDSNVVEKWISGHYAVVDKFKERIGAPKTLHSLWKRRGC